MHWNGLLLTAGLTIAGILGAVVAWAALAVARSTSASSRAMQRLRDGEVR